MRPISPQCVRVPQPFVAQHQLRDAPQASISTEIALRVLGSDFCTEAKSGQRRSLRFRIGAAVARNGILRDDRRRGAARPIRLLGNPQKRKGPLSRPFFIPSAIADYAACEAVPSNLRSSSTGGPDLSATPIYLTRPAIFAFVTFRSPNSRPNVGSASGSLFCSSHQAQ